MFDFLFFFYRMGKEAFFGWRDCLCVFKVDNLSNYLFGRKYIKERIKDNVCGWFWSREYCYSRCFVDKKTKHVTQRSVLVFFYFVPPASIFSSLFASIPLHYFNQERNFYFYFTKF